MKIGITGGIACGKTTVLALFARMGCQTLNADSLAHEILINNKDVRDAIVEKFGKTLLAKDDSINRSKLAEKVFSTKEDLDFLEDLLHPLIIEKIITAMENTNANWAVEVPLLFEKKLEKYFDYTVCVETSENLQEKFLFESKIPLQSAELRKRLQMPLKEKNLKADFVISNTGTLEFLWSQVKSLMEELRVANT